MTRLLHALTHVAAAVAVALLLVATGQPLFTDDLWWHLALGRAYAAMGPWLVADPLLHTAAGPPTPAAWLADLSLFHLQDALGFQALRILHVAMVATIVTLSWIALRLNAQSAAIASLGTATFALLSAFRLFQLRPHLFTVLAALALYLLIFAKQETPSRLRIACVALLCALWANLHSGFLLGPILLAAALAGVTLVALLGPLQERPLALERAKALALALIVGALATLLNPSGWDPHLSYFIAGVDTPSLLGVGDDWAPFRLFQFPDSPLPPSPLDWTIVWALMLSVPAAAIWATVHLFRRTGTERSGVDPALIALACISLPAMLLAVRFLWLVIFPLLFLARCSFLRFGNAPKPLRAAGLAIAASLLTLGFLEAGSWQSISRGIPRAPGTYLSTSYPAAKYYAHSVWFLADAQLEGKLFNDYIVGGFLAFWLAPELQGFQNGTLNFPRDTLVAIRALRKRRGLEGGPSFTALLDEHEVDVFQGIRLPERLAAGPWYYSTAHLERAPGWLLVFRDLRSSVYLRNNARNQPNLERIADYYEQAGIPFDRELGFQPSEVVRANRSWAVRHGMLPINFDAVAANVQSARSHQRAQALDTLASTYVALGIYEDALVMDQRLLGLLPNSYAARRRRIWSLVRLDRREEALAEAGMVETSEHRAPLLQWLARAAESYVQISDPERAAATAALLPVLTPPEARRLSSLIVAPEARPGR